ncbi:MAG: ABATE domain-containing protein [Actinomycetota bacterium]
MEPLDLDPGEYGGTYKLIGGRPALDLVNTVSWPRTEREHDWLDPPANLDRWCAALDLPPGPTATTGDVETARSLRADLAAALTPLAFGDHPPPGAIHRLNAHVAVAAARRQLSTSDLCWTWRPASSAAERLAPVVLDGAELVAADSHARLRRCDACGWLFEDGSRNGRRRWCDMADCGSRAKSRSYYRRTTGSTADG